MNDIENIIFAIIWVGFFGVLLVLELINLKQKSRKQKLRNINYRIAGFEDFVNKASIDYDYKKNFKEICSLIEQFLNLTPKMIEFIGQDIDKIINTVVEKQMVVFNESLKQELSDYDYKTDFKKICSLIEQLPPNLTPKMREFIGQDIDKIISTIEKHHTVDKRIEAFNELIHKNTISENDNRWYKIKDEFKEIYSLILQLPNLTPKMIEFIGQDIDKIINTTVESAISLYNKYGNSLNIKEIDIFLEKIRYLASQTSKLTQKNRNDIDGIIQQIAKGLIYYNKSLNYVPKRYLNMASVSEEAKRQTQMLLNYKNYAKFDNFYSRYAFHEINKLMFLKLEDIIHRINIVYGKKARIVLCACPSSAPDKKNTVQLSINEFAKSVKADVLDCSNLFVRNKAITPSHLSGNRDISQHLDSICIVNDMYNLDFTDKNLFFIICDDIYTTGNTIKACKTILKKQSVSDENIFIYTIAQTERLLDE